VRGDVFFKEFFENYNDPRVILLGNKADVYVDPEIDRAFPEKTGTRLTIKTRTQEYSLFEEDWPEITEQFVKEKFTKLVSSHLSQKDVGKIMKNMLHLEELGNMRELTANCVRRYKN
jgi:2-methylcitrate dehydratase PrpD